MPRLLFENMCVLPQHEWIIVSKKDNDWVLYYYKTDSEKNSSC